MFWQQDYVSYWNISESHISILKLQLFPFIVQNTIARSLDASKQRTTK